jgi:hypothetical protein
MSKDKEKVSTEIALQQANPLDIHKFISSQLQALKTRQETAYKSSGNISLAGESINIKSLTNLGTLIDTTGRVLLYAELYEKAAVVLKLEKYPEVSLNGNSVENILHDLKLRADIVTMDETRSKLQKHLDKLNSHFSKEDRLNRDLHDMAEDLGMSVEELKKVHSDQ